MFIRDHVLVHVFPRSTHISEWLHLFSCACQSGPLEVGWQGGSSSHMFTLTSGAASSCPGIFGFTSCVVRHLGYSFSLDSQPFLVCTPWSLAHFCALSVLVFPALLLRGLLLIVSYLTFSEGSPKWSEELEVSSTQPGLEDTSRFYWRSPSCLQVASSIWMLLTGRILVGSYWYRGSLLIKGLKLFSERLLHDCERFPSDFPYLLVSSYLYKERSRGAIFPSIRRALF